MTPNPTRNCLAAATAVMAMTLQTPAAFAKDAPDQAARRASALVAWMTPEEKAAQLTTMFVLDDLRRRFSVTNALSH